MIVIIPFIKAILSHCMQSGVFKPPNPWIISLYRLLAEIYQLPHLKLPIKFDIELLGNTLGIDPNKIEPTYITQNLRVYRGSEIHDFDEIPEVYLLFPFSW